MDAIFGKAVAIIQKLDEAVSLIIASTSERLESRQELEDSCNQLLNLLRAVLRSENNVHHKQSLLHLIGLVRCHLARLEASSIALGGSLFAKRPRLTINRLQQQQQQQVTWIDLDTAFNNRMRTSVIANISHIDLATFLHDAAQLFKTRVGELLQNEYSSFKINTVLTAKFVKSVTVDGEEVEQIEDKHFNTQNVAIFRTTDISKWFNEHVLQRILTDVEEFQGRDSGWSLRSITKLQVNINNYNPMHHGGRTFFPLLKSIQDKHACVNVHNRDNQCFKWAILSALYPPSSNPQRLSNYLKYDGLLNMEGIDYPVKLQDVTKFEKQNDWLSINIFGLSDDSSSRQRIMPLHVTADKRDTHINLLFIQKSMAGGEEQIAHYVWIRNLSRLVSKNLSQTNRHKYICDRCLHYFSTEQQLMEHEVRCKKMNSECRIRLPKSNNRQDVVKFKNFLHKERVPFMIYADCECLLLSRMGEESQDQVDDCEDNWKTEVIHKHEMFSIAYYLKCAYDENLSKFMSYQGADPAKWFAEELRKIAIQVDQLYKNPLPMETLTLEEQRRHQEPHRCCHICGEKFELADLRVRDHCHLTGKYRGPAHEGCNLNYHDSRVIPIVFHNLSGYDAHLIIHDISNHFPGNVDMLPISKETYISFTKHVEGYDIQLRFIDSFRFMAKSLDKLASYLNGFK